VSFVAECECRGEFVVASKVVHSRHRIAAGMSKLPQALMTFTPSTRRGSRGALAGFGGNPHRAGLESHHKLLCLSVLFVTRRDCFANLYYYLTG
jgi:hypothetical protein